MARQHLGLVTGQGGATAGHGVGHPGDVRGHDVEIALHDHRHTAVVHGRTGEIDAEECASLVIDGCLRGVEVFGNVGAQRPCAEGQHLAALVADGEHEAMAKPVAQTAAPGVVGEAGVDDLVGRRSGTLPEVARQ